MADNAADISRDSFTFANFYDSVRLQDGVPIMDSDWNEMEDIRRIHEMLILIYGFGTDMQFTDSSGYAGFEPYGDDQSNDFPLRGGAAIVRGTLILSSAADPPAAFDYDSVTNNYSDCGIVTAVSGGSITDDYKKWQSLGSFGDALVPSAYQGGARVVMTSGVENGNTFTVTAVPNNTQLTLSGGTGSIAPGDTYNVLPPALTTPGGSRTDEVFLMVWWEDIAGDEDDNTPLIHPMIGIESCHRYKRKWAVRVTEGGTTPANSGSIHGFGIRYLKIAEIARTATATITNAMVTPETSLHVPNYSGHTIDGGGHGISGDYTSTTLTGINAGGIGTGHTTFEQIFDAIDETVMRRRAFTAVITDGTASTGGDFESADAIDEVSGTLAEGTFFVRRGDYEWSIAGLGSNDRAGVVIGESKSSVTIEIPSGASADFPLVGKFKHVTLGSNHASYNYTVENTVSYPVTLEGCNIEAGTFNWDQGQLYMRDCQVTTSGVSTSTRGFSILQSVANAWEHHEGLIDNCIFSGVSAVAPTEEDTLYIYNLSHNIFDAYIRPITISNSEIAKSSTSRNALRISDCVDVPIVFSGCTFRSGSTTTSTPLIYLEDSTDITFRDCRFYNYGPLLDCRNTGVMFENCTFIEDGTSYSAQIFSCEGGYDKDNPAVFRDCRIVLGGGGFSATGSTPAIEFGGRGGTGACDSILVDGLTIVFDSSTAIHRYTPVTLRGSLITGGSATYKNVVVDCNGAESTIDRTTYGSLGVASIVEVVGGAGFPVVQAENLKIHSLSNPTVDDDSTVFIGRVCTINGLEIDGSGTNSNTMGNSPYGLIYCDADCRIYDLELFKTNEILCAASRNVIVLGESNAGIFNSHFDEVPTNAINNFVSISGQYCKCEGNTFELWFGGDQAFTVIYSADDFVSICNNTIRRGTNTSLAEPYIENSGEGCRIVNNSIYATTLPSTSDVAIENTGNACIIDGNTVAVSTTEAGTPTIANSGTGSVTGDNVLTRVTFT